MGKVFSTRFRWIQGSQETLGPAFSKRRTHTLPASYMVSRVRKGPQRLEGFTLQAKATSTSPQTSGTSHSPPNLLQAAPPQIPG